MRTDRFQHDRNTSRKKSLSPRLVKSRVGMQSPHHHCSRVQKKRLSENIALSTRLRDDCRRACEVTAHLLEHLRTCLSIIIPDPWQQVFAEECKRAETRYELAVEQYLALLERGKPDAPDRASHLQRLDTAKRAVDRCREYYHSLLPAVNDLRGVSTP